MAVIPDSSLIGNLLGSLNAYSSQFSPPEKLAVFASKKPLSFPFAKTPAGNADAVIGVKQTVGFTAEAETEMAEMERCLTDPRDFDDAFLAAKIEAAQADIMSALISPIEASLLSPDTPLIS